MNLTMDSDILVEASYWYDSQLNTEINWTIRNIIASKNLQGSYITYYSDLVTNILLWVDNGNINTYVDDNWNVNTTLINTRLNNIINELQVEDINVDGILNRDDINYHNIVNDVSNLTYQIPWYERAIIDWDKEEKQAIIDDLGIDVGGWDSLLNLSSNANYQTLELLDTESFEQKKQLLITEIDELDTEVNQINWDLQTNLVLQDSLSWEIDTAKISVVNFYNSLDSSSKILLDPTKSTTEKYYETANIISNSQTNDVVFLSSYNSLPNSSEITEWKTVLITRANTILAEIEPLKRDRDAKKIIYDQKYAEYLEAKANYEEDQRLKEYWNDRYEEYKESYNDLVNQNEYYKRQKDLASDNLAKLDKPNPNDYSVTSDTYPRLAWTNPIDSLTFTHWWMSFEWFLKLPNDWSFPWIVWMESNLWKTNDISVKDVNHFFDEIRYLENLFKFKLDYMHYEEAIEQIKATWNLINWKEIRDEADVERFFYGLLDYLEINHYNYEEQAYLESKIEYEEASSLLQTKLNALEVVKQKLLTYWIKLSDVVDYENNLVTAITENNELNDLLTVFSWLLNDKENELIYYEATNPETENEGQIEERINLLNFDYESPYNLDTTSNNFALYPWAYLEIKNWYTGVIKNRNNIVFQWTQDVVDEQKYLNFTYTVYVKFNRYWTGNDYPALLWIEYKQEAWDNLVYSTERIELNSREDLSSWVISDLVKKVKADIDLRRNGMGDMVNDINYDLSLNNIKSLFNELQIASNDWWWWDWRIEELQWLSPEQIEKKVETFSQRLFDHKYKYDAEFKLNFDNEVVRQTDLQKQSLEFQLWRELTQAEIDEIITNTIEWTKNGTIKWTSDYVMQYYDLFVSLSEITFEDISNWLSSMWWFVKSPIDSIASWYETLKDGLVSVVDRLEHLWAYEYSFWWWYVWVNIALLMADPAGKIRNMWWWVWKVVTKIDIAILELIESVLTTKVAKLWQAYVTKFHNLTTKVAVKFDKGMQEHIIKRLWMMDQDILRKNLDNLDNFIDSFDGGDYPILMKADDFWERVVLKNVNWKIVDWRWFPIDKSEVDFIVIESNWQDWIVFWKNHSYLSNWKNINYAWELKFNKNTWNIIWFTNRSGHYLPDSNDLEWLQKLKNAYFNRFKIEFDIDFTIPY